MENEALKDRLKRVANTLCATRMRADDVEATDRIRACVRELLSMIEELTEEGGETDE